MKPDQVIDFFFFLSAGCGGGGYSGGNSSGREPAAPTGVTVNSGTSSGSVVINWAPVAGASSYKIFYDTSQNNSIVNS